MALTSIARRVTALLLTLSCALSLPSGPAAAGTGEAGTGEAGTGEAMASPPPLGCAALVDPEYVALPLSTTETRIQSLDGSQVATVEGAARGWSADGRLALLTPDGARVDVIGGPGGDEVASVDVGGAQVWGWDVGSRTGDGWVPTGADRLLIGDGADVVAVDPDDGQRTVIATRAPDVGLDQVSVSPDGRRVAALISREGLSAAVGLGERGGSITDLTDRIAGLRSVAWTVDSRSLVIMTGTTVEVVGLAGQRRVLADLAPMELTDISVSPNGRDVLATGFVPADDRHDDDQDWFRTVVLDLGGSTAPVRLDRIEGRTIASTDVDPTGTFVLAGADEGFSEFLRGYGVAALPPFDQPGRMIADGDISTAAYFSSFEQLSGAWSPRCEVLRRIAGETRIETAVAISEYRWAPGLGTADAAPVLVRSDDYTDALVAAPLTRGRAPLLLTTRDRLHPATAAELARLGASEVTVVGDPSAISQQVTDDLAAMGIAVERIEAADRYATAAAIAPRLPGNLTFVTRGDGPDGWADALTVGSWATRDGHPILLTATDDLPDATRDAAVARGVRVVIVGGEAAVSRAVEDALVAEGLEVVRIAGATRYGTAVAVAEAGFPDRPPSAWIATGINWPDALAVGPAAAFDAIPIILTPPTGPVDAPEQVRPGWVIDELITVGGPDVVSPAAARQITAGR